MNYWGKVLKNLLILALSVLGFYLGFKLVIFYMPFLVAFIISLLLEPCIRFIMRKTKLRRKTSSIIIFIIAIVAVVIYKVNNDKEKQQVQEPTTSTVEEEIVKEITLGVAEFDTMNPILSPNKHVQEISRIIYEPLLELDEEYKIQKCLAKDWAKTSSTTYLIKIRDDVLLISYNTCSDNPSYPIKDFASDLKKSLSRKANSRLRSASPTPPTPPTSPLSPSPSPMPSSTTCDKEESQ